jgi:putative transposase
VPRQPRGPLPAGIYHVTGRGCGGPSSIFVDDFDRTRFCQLLIGALVGMEARCYAFCLMTTHYHVLLDVPAADVLQAAMRRLNSAYAFGFNRKHGRVGHLFAERFGCIPVLSDWHVLRGHRYLARNPLAAGLCERPEDHYWSSYRDAIGLSNDFPFVDSSCFRSYFGSDAAGAIEAMRRFVNEPLDAAGPDPDRPSWGTIPL